MVARGCRLESVPTLIDLILLILVLVVVPLHAVAEGRRVRRSLDEGGSDTRLAAYGRIIAWQWGAAAVLGVVWVLTGRSVALLGIAVPTGLGFLIAAVLALVAIGLLAFQSRAVRTRTDLQEQVRTAAAPLRWLLPATPPEMRRFTWVGLTAGTVEELVYRGYMMWLLAQFAPMWVALGGSALAFGIAHSYQGLGGFAKTAAVGLGLGGLYWLSGSLWVPMILHASFDVLQGRMLYDVIRRPAGEAAAVPPRSG